MPVAYLSLGSNVGDRKQNLIQALELMSQRVAVERLSSVYETEPVGYEQQPLFLNAVCQVSTKLSPEQLLVLVKGIETKLGRIPSFPNAPRPIDIDILLYNDRVISTPKLTIPHPRLVERAFVLVPLIAIAPKLVHPVNRKTINELLNNLGTVSGVRKWAGAEEVMKGRQNVSGVC